VGASILRVKQDLRGRRFTTDQQLDVTVHVWLVSQPKNFYSEVIKQIVWWWTKCVVKQGDCVEKLCSCKISALVFINMKHTVRIISDSPSYLSTYKISETKLNFYKFFLENIFGATEMACLYDPSVFSVTKGN